MTPSRSLPARAAALALAALALAGCGSVDLADRVYGGSEEDAAVLASITWVEDTATGATTLNFDQPLEVTAAAALLVEEGDGDLIATGQSLSLAYTVTSGQDGAVEYSTYEQGAPEVVALAADSLDPVLFEVLEGRRVGAQVIYAIPDTTATGSVTALLAVTVVSAFDVLDRAEGAPVDPVPGLPEVTLAADGAPSIDIPGGAEPAELVSQTLIQGEGAVVEAGQTITAHYSGWLWDGTAFDSSWGSTPLSITLAPGSVIDGWTQGLAGQSVGSQVLLIVPPELGYGDVDRGTIPPNSTLVFVVDILAVG